MKRALGILLLLAMVAAMVLGGCRPTPCDCAFDSTLEAALAACPPDPSFPADLGVVDLATPVQAIDDGGAPVDPGTPDLGPPTSCISVHRVVVAEAALRQGRSPVSLVLDTLKLDEKITAIAERSAFSNETVYRVVQRGDKAACGYVESAKIAVTEKSRTIKRSVDPATDGAECIGGRK